MIKGEECGVQQQQMNETSQVIETTDDLTSMTSEDQDIMFSATFMVIFKSAYVRHFRKARAAQSVKIGCRSGCV